MAKRKYDTIGTNNGKSLMHEDMSKPCGLPYGAHVKELDMSEQANLMAGRPKDLYELVNDTMKEDAKNLRSLTKPRNF